MKKILAFLSAAVFLGSSTLAVSACGVSKGQEIKVEIENSPKEAKENEDPLVDYVYNDKYVYSSPNVNYLLSLAAQLTNDKIYNKQSSFDSPIWKEFFSSNEWQRGYFSSFHYDLTDVSLPSGENDFSYKDANDQNFIIQVKNNDLSDDNNKINSYWFITSANPWSRSTPTDYQPTKNNITIPDISEFNDEVTTIIKTGWVHFYLLIGSFRIDFSAEINFNFVKMVDKNNQPAVLLSVETFAKPFGTIDFNDPEKTYDKVINSIDISKVV